MKPGQCVICVFLCVLLHTCPTDEASSSSAPSSGSGATSKRPNVLFLVVDDLAAVISSYQGRAWTPNIDQLASQSVLFTNAYAQQALCAPSRLSFLTSRRPDTTKTYFNTASYWRTRVGNFTTLPQYFRDAGYFTASSGKVFHHGHVSGRKEDFKFSWSTLPYVAPTLRYGYKPTCPGPDGKLHFNLLCPVNVSSQPLASLPDIQTTDHLLGLLRNLSNSRGTDGATADNSSEARQPFFLAMGFHKPHVSFRYPKEFLGLYPLESVDIAPNAFYQSNQPSVAWNPFMSLRKREDIGSLNLTFPYGPMPRKYHYLIRQSYYAATTYMDYEVGRVLAGLEEAGFADDTIITFVSDHGWQLGEHQEWAKFSNAAMATRVPLLVHVPGQTASMDGRPKFPLRDALREANAASRGRGRGRGPVTPGSISDALVELTDLFPTLAELAGLPVPPLCPEDSATVDTCVEGVSLAPLLGRPANATAARRWKRAAFTQYPRPSDRPRPDSDQPTLANTTIMGYSMHTVDGHHYTEWVGFDNVTCRADWHDVHARELYILRTDPLENNNVANVPSNQDLVTRLSTELQQGWRHALPPSSRLS